MKISDASSMVYDNTDWEHPSVKQWTATPFYTFASNNVSWACSYANGGSTTIQEGQSAATNEMCMATGYYFPAMGPKFEVELYNNGSPSQCVGL